MPYADQTERRDYYRNYMRNWRAVNRDTIRAYDRSVYERSSKRRLQMRDRLLRTRYGITLVQYNEMLTVQDNKCAICENTFVRPAHTDHCHVTGRVRKLLCDTCNKGLGQFKENAEFLRRAASYLESFV